MEGKTTWQGMRNYVYTYINIDKSVIPNLFTIAKYDVAWKYHLFAKRIPYFCHLRIFEAFGKTQPFNWPNANHHVRHLFLWKTQNGPSCWHSLYNTDIKVFAYDSIQGLQHLTLCLRSYVKKWSQKSIVVFVCLFGNSVYSSWMVCSKKDVIMSKMNDVWGECGLLFVRQTLTLIPFLTLNQS